MVALDISTTLNDLVSCVCAGLVDIDRPACGCGLTVGPPVVGLEQCCQCDTDTTGQVTANLERVFPADGATLEQVTRLENCSPGVTAADVTIVVTRCYPRIDETGHMPDLDATTEAAENLHSDVAATWQALKCCGTRIVFRESAVDADPDGGCSAFAVRVTVPVSLAVEPVVVAS